MSAKLLTFPVPVVSDSEFQAAVDLETGGDTAGAVKAYTEILARCEDFRAAINLGTILYNKKQYAKAEVLYRRAVTIEPKYCLAWFDLGNALDELGRAAEGMEAYRAALEVEPNYPDAIYNLAIALEKSGRKAEALNYWRAYVRLDGSSVYGSHAAGMVQRTMALSRLTVAHRGQVRASTQKNDRLSLSQKPLPDGDESGLIHRLTLLNSPERAAINADPQSGFSDS